MTPTDASAIRFKLACGSETGQTQSCYHLDTCAAIRRLLWSVLSWQERHRIVDQLAALGMSSYVYAPKEDVNHRSHGVPPGTANGALTLPISAPMLRAATFRCWPELRNWFDFHNEINEFKNLVQKSNQLVEAGADAIFLMFDDIEPDPENLPDLAARGPVPWRDCPTAGQRDRRAALSCATDLCR